jgi:hypothetical protein
MKTLVNSVGSSGMLYFARILEYFYKKQDKFENILYDEFDDEFYVKYVNLYNIDNNKTTFFINTDLKIYNSYGIKVKKPLKYIENISILQSMLKPQQIIKYLPKHFKFYLHRDARDVIVSMLNRMAPSDDDLTYNLTKSELANSDFVVLSIAILWKKHISSFLKTKNKFNELSFYNLKNNLDSVIKDLNRYYNSTIQTNEINDFFSKQNNKFSLKQDGKKFGKYLDFFDDDSINLIKTITSNELYKLKYIDKIDNKSYNFDNLRLYNLNKNEVTIKEIKNSDILIYGTGNLFFNSKDIFESYFNIVNLIDDDPWHTDSGSYDAILLEELEIVKDYDFILVCTIKIFTSIQMINRLIDKGVPTDKILSVYPIDMKSIGQ